MIAAKVFVLMSHQENFGIAIAEAMAAACPVIISDQLDLAQDIEFAKAGIVCIASPDRTAAALRRLVSDDALRQRMGANGRALVLRRFTWSLIAATLIDEYRKVISNYEWSGWSA